MMPVTSALRCLIVTHLDIWTWIELGLWDCMISLLIIIAVQMAYHISANMQKPILLLQPFYGTLDSVWDYPGELVPER